MTTRRLSDIAFRQAVLGDRPPPNAWRAYELGFDDGSKDIEALRQEIRLLIEQKNRLEEMLQVGFPATIEFEGLPSDLGGWLKTDRITLAAVHDILANGERPHARLGDHQVISRHRIAYINIRPCQSEKDRKAT